MRSGWDWSLTILEALGCGGSGCDILAAVRTRMEWERATRKSLAALLLSEKQPHSV